MHHPSPAPSRCAGRAACDLPFVGHRIRVVERADGGWQETGSPAGAVTFDDIPDDVAHELRDLSPNTIAVIDECFQDMPTTTSTVSTQHMEQQARARPIRLQAVCRGFAQKKKYQQARARGMKRKSVMMPGLVEEEEEVAALKC